MRQNTNNDVSKGYLVDSARCDIYGAFLMIAKYNLAKKKTVS